MSIQFPDLQLLLQTLRSIPENGSVWLAEQRTFLMSAGALAWIRQELITSLGVDAARGLLMRMGYRLGASDAYLARRMGQKTDESLLLGPQLHSLRGMVKVHPHILEYAPDNQHFYAEIDWLDSFEVEAGQQADSPVCWLLLGYACAYSSHLCGLEIQYREVACQGCGAAHCRIIGRPAEQWPDHQQFRDWLAPLAADESRLMSWQRPQLGLSSDEHEPMPCVSSAWLEAQAMLDRVAASDMTVLLGGETGTGKELMARRLHALSRRNQKPFVAFNCATLPPELIEAELFGVEKGAFTGAQHSRPGRFERADGGTLFLDEIMELPARAQAALLRVLQEGELEPVGGTALRRVNVRVVAATHADLEQAVQQGRFRADLYYRINAHPVVLPALRHRRADILPLAEYFLHKEQHKRGCQLKGFSAAACQALLEHDWPGNVRELENLVQRAVLLSEEGSEIAAEGLFSGFALQLSQATADKAEYYAQRLLEQGVSLAQLENSLLSGALNKAEGNLSAAARLLGLSRPAFAYRNNQQR